MKICISIIVWDTETDICFHLDSHYTCWKTWDGYTVSVFPNYVALCSNFQDCGMNFSNTSPKFYRQIGKIIYKHRIFQKDVMKDFEKI